MEFLRDAFAGVDEAIVEAVWEECAHDLERAMEVLFEMAPAEAETEERTQAEAPAPAVDEDMRLAMELQRQFDEEDRQRERRGTAALGQAPLASVHQPPLGMEAREMPDDQFAALLESQRALELEIRDTQDHVDRAAQLELDEQLARQLMQEEHRTATSASGISEADMSMALMRTTGGGLPSRHGGVASLVGGEAPYAGSLDLANLFGDSDFSLEQVNEVIKENIIPTIVEEVQGFRLPAVDEQVDVPRLGQVQFSCSGSTMEEVVIPKEDVKLSIEGDVIRFKIKKMQAKLSKFDWRYSQSQFPKLKDKGKATARLDGASFEVAFRIGRDGAEVIESKVSVGKVRVSVSGTRKSIIYNVVIATVIGLLKPVVERELAKLVRAMLGDTGYTSDSDDEQQLLGRGISGLLM